MHHNWDLEQQDISENQERTLTTKDSAILRNFHDTFQLEKGRRIVSLPRIEDVILSSNLNNAEKRFKSLQRRFNDTQFREMYYSQMLDYIRKGHVETVAYEEYTNSNYYLPHHAIKKQKRGVIKWRIVFDASSHERHSPSLNDALEPGPNLLPEILSTLLRFRTYRRAIIGDGTQAFLQLSLDRNDRDLTRFFWFRVEGKGN